MRSTPGWRVALVASLLLAASATPASADLVYLTSGRTLSVKAIAFVGDTATMTLRTGGEIICDRGLVDRVEPDEVPWPDPAPDAVAATGGLASAGDAAAAPPVRPPEIPQAYRALVTGLAKTHGVDPRLVHAVITVESAYRPRARSPKGARGLMQLMPATARQYGVRNAYRPSANLEAGIKHLRSLLDRFEVHLALAAYNAGEAAVRKFGGIPPYRETQTYVTRVLALAGLSGAPRVPTGQAGS